jgi:hypothetical protein
MPTAVRKANLRRFYTLLSTGVGAITVLCAVAGGCSNTPAAPSSGGEPDTLLGEDVDAPAFSADDLTSGLPPKHLVKALTVARARFVVTSPLSLVGGGVMDVGATFATLRALTFDSKDAVVLVNLNTLSTHIALKAELALAAKPSDVTGTAFDSATARTAGAGGISNQLAAVAGTPPPRAALTVDMCQSSKPWDKALFDWAVAQSDALGRPFPIAIAMTGGWASKHAVEFKQLQTWKAAGKLAIRWVNHSLTHPLNCNAAKTSCAFLTSSTVNFDSEVLGLEQMLIEQGETPSVVFRFPGLTHNAQRRGQMQALGLFGIDGNAWLAKGEKIKDGSVILVHGNGNEPVGIRLFLEAMRTGTFAGGEAQGKLRFVAIEQSFVP